MGHISQQPNFDRSSSRTPTAQLGGRAFVVPSFETVPEKTIAPSARSHSGIDLLSFNLFAGTNSAPTLQPQRQSAPETTEESSEEIPELSPARSHSGIDLLSFNLFAGTNSTPTLQPQRESAIETAEESSEEMPELSPARSPDSFPPAEPNDPPPIQPKLTIGQPNDRYEQEADRVAAQVMRMPDPAMPSRIQRQTRSQDDDNLPLQAKPIVFEITPFVQRQVQAKGSEAVSADFEQQLTRSRSGGQALPEPVRSFMEPRFGADFSQVRVHTGESAVQMNKAIGAQAFTHGSDVYYGAGKAPGNDELTAHELTHVVQQTGNRNIQRRELNRDRHKPELSPFNVPNQGLESDVKASSEMGQTLDLNQVDLNKENKADFLTTSKPESDVNSNSPQSPSKPGTIEQESLDPTTKLDHQPSITQTPIQPPAGQPFKNDLGLEEIAKNNVKNNAKNNIVGFGSDGTTKQNKEDSPETKSLSPIPSPNPVATPPDQLAKAAKDSTNQAKAAVVPPQVAPNQAVPTQGEMGAIAPASTGLEIPTASGAAPALDMGSGGAEAAAVPEVGDDPALEAVAQETEGVELPADAKAEASGDLSAIAAEGGEAPASMGGGGGGGAIADKPTPPVPDVSQSEDPAQALATVANLPPVQLQSALGGVGAAVDKSVNKEKAEITNNPPQMEVGAEGVAGSATDKVLPIGAAPKAVAKAPEGQSKPTPEPKPLPNLPAPAKSAVTPMVQGGTDGKLSSQDVQNLQASLNRLPTQDPAASALKADAPPPLKLEGDANPQQAQEQRAKLESSVNETYAQGQREAAQPLGEDQIKATVPKELIKAEGGGQAVGGAGGAVPAGVKAGGGAGGAAGADDGISIIAQEQQGAEIQAAVAQAQGQMAAERQGHQAKVTQEKQKSQEEINKLQADNATEQQQEKLKAKTEADQLRSDWTKEQDQLVTQSRKEADEEISKGNQAVQTEQVQAEQKAQQEIATGNQKAEVERQKGEQQAEAERQKGQKESSGGFFGWLADKAKAFFDEIKQGIQRAFEAARAAIKSAIEAAQKLATAAIEAGRKAIVGIIRRVGDALIALGDKLLANFPGLRDRFRKLIQDKVKQAEDAVNRIADNLKKNVKAALDLLAKGLDAALGLLQKGLMAAVDIANKVVQGAISAAKAAAEALGVFAVLIKDIASNPGQWITNLAAGVMDGIKNHLWGAFQTAIQEWFNQKLEEVLGLGMTVWNFLKQGGMNLAEVGQMAWEGIKAEIPPMLITILVEQVAKLIIPGLGAVMAIIDSLQAAWGTVSKLLQAMERFVGFLKAVKSGAAGPLFGQLLAAAGVVLVDFVSNFLLKKIRGAASKVAGKIKAIAQKIGNKLKGVFAKEKKGSGKPKDKFLGGKDSKDGKPSRKKKQSPEDKEKEELEKKQKKVDRAVTAATVAVNALAGKRVGKTVLIPILQGIKRAFGLKILEPVEDGDNWAVYGEINPHSKKKTNAKVGWGRGQIPCFPAGTFVSTPNGTCVIESLHVGDKVYAYDFQTKSVVTRQILALYHGSTNSWVDIHVGSSILRTTKQHPIWVESEQKWIEAHKLASGMKLRLKNEEILGVNRIEILPQRIQQHTYNLTVEAVNNFFAGELQILVHNNNSRMNRKGYRNYVLIDKNDKIYYSGMFGSNQTPQDVERRHGQNNNRFDRKNGDRMVVVPGSRTYKESRKLEHEKAVKEGTFIGKKGKNYRGNRQYPMNEKSFKRYYESNAC
jgi:Domain of unknown function (DUF4157)/Pretoxin HINT domain